MGRRCAICDQKAARSINKMLAAGCSYRDISRLYGGRKGLSKHSLSRHRKEHIPELIRKAAADREVNAIEEARDLLGQSAQYLRSANKMLRACDEWLKGPNGEYCLEPRDNEVKIFYSDLSTGQEVRHVALLSELLKKLTKKDKKIVVSGWRYRHADPRDLLLKAIDRGAKVVELLGRITGELRADFNLQVAIVADPVWPEVLRILTDALRPHPLAFRQVVEGLRNLKLLPTGGSDGKQAG